MHPVLFTAPPIHKEPQHDHLIDHGSPLKQEHSTSKRDQRKPAGVHFALDPRVRLHHNAIHSRAPVAASLLSRGGFHRAGEAHERAAVVRGSRCNRRDRHDLGSVGVDGGIIGW